jgi:hypothetical protein
MNNGCPILLVSLMKLPLTRKYAHMSRPYSKDKPGTLNLKAPTIFKVINLTMNTLIEGVPLLDFSNNPKCLIQ